MPADRSRPAFRAPDPLLPQRARRAATGVDEGCGKILRCSAGCFAGLGAAAAAAGFRAVRWWPDRTDMRRRNSYANSREASGKHGRRRT